MKKALSLTLAIILMCSLFSANVFAMSTSDEGLTFMSYGNGTCYLHRTSAPTDTTVTIPPLSPDGETVICIDDEVFLGRSDITSIIMPDTVTNIGEGSFSGCSGITNINIPDAVTDITAYAFSFCTSLESITLPESLTYLGYYAFSYCPEITSINIGAGVIYFGNYAFSFCPKLESISVDSANTTYHSTSNCIIKTATKTLMLGCKSSSIPSDGSVTVIGEGAFAGCSELTSISIPEGITSIGENAFFDCQGLESITIPSSVKSIGIGAFSDCPSLAKIYYEGSAEEWDSIVKGDGWDLYAGESTANGSYSVEYSLPETEEPATEEQTTELSTEKINTEEQTADAESSDVETTSEESTNTPDTSVNADTRGCNGSVNLSALALVSILATCTAVVRKKKTEII